MRVRIESVIGEQITRAREDVGMSQSQLGDELGRLLGKPWPRQAVSQAEKGRRSFNAAELVAFAAALGRSVESLLVPPADVSTVTLADGDPIDSRHLRGDEEVSSDDNLRKLTQTMGELRREFPGLVELVDRLDDLIGTAALDLWATARGRGVEVDRDVLGLPPRRPEQ
jgi:transcriptional regulator with XRE-family HTH domain